ncbi:MAG: hypothetical protein QNK04_08925 [Myxococcota bacterium]|nr:hypothetical protein [Myxococcota bacterium]
MQRSLSWLMACFWLAVAGAATGDEGAVSDADLAYEDRIAELERMVGVLASELERTRMDTAVPETRELTSQFGLGPGASRIYGITQGLSIGGYGEAFYKNYVDDETRVRTGQFSESFSTARENNEMDFLRAIVYVGYKFTDNIVFNSEIEIEHADEIFLEFAQLDFFWQDWMNFRTGLMLLPVGWINEIHEPPFFYGVNRPDVERFIIPTTWRENGFGVFGSIGEYVQYRIYGVNGLDGSEFGTQGIRGGRQKGSQALADDLAVVGRVDFTPTPGVIVGGSFYVGNSGQDQEGEGGKLPGSRTTLFDVHAQWKWQGLHLRGLFTMLFIDDAARLSSAINGGPPGFSIAETMLGGYAEVAYDVLQWFDQGERTLEPYYRFEYYDTQWEVPSGFSRDKTKEIVSHTVGVQYEPIPNVVLKADYRARKPNDGRIADEWNMGIGYVF